MSPHLDTDALADVLAGLEAGAAQPDHLDGCAGCQAALTQLSTAMAQVTVVLAELPEPELPEGLTSRIEAALAALAPVAAPHSAVDASPPAHITPLPAATITPTRVSRSGPPRWLKAAGGLSAAAALVVGVVLVINSGSGRSGSGDSATSAAAIARNSTGAAYTKDATTLTGNLKALLKGNAPAVASPMLGAAVPETVTPSSAADNRAKALSTVDALAPLRGSTALAACLASLSDPGDPGVPLALDYGTFEGQPALLVLLPGGKASSVLAFFVGPQCNEQDSHLLYYEKVAAP